MLAIVSDNLSWQTNVQAAAQMLAIVSDNRMARDHLERMHEFERMHGISATSHSMGGANVGGASLSWDDDLPPLINK